MEFANSSSDSALHCIGELGWAGAGGGRMERNGTHRKGVGAYLEQ